MVKQMTGLFWNADAPLTKMKNGSFPVIIWYKSPMVAELPEEEDMEDYESW